MKKNELLIIGIVLLSALAISQFDLGLGYTAGGTTISIDKVFLDSGTHQLTGEGYLLTLGASGRGENYRATLSEGKVLPDGKEVD